MQNSCTKSPNAKNKHLTVTRFERFVFRSSSCHQGEIGTSE